MAKKYRAKRLFQAAGAIGLLLAIVGFLCHATAPRARLAAATKSEVPGNAMPLGMNLASVSDWSDEWSFVDIYKRSRPWILEGQKQTDAKGRPQVVPAATDALGWPVLQVGQTAVSYIGMDLEGHFPSGKYICTYEGEGDLTFSIDAKAIEHAKARGRMVVEVKSRKGIQMRLRNSNPANPLRNIHIWTPGMEGAASPFHPLFVSRLEPFRVLRFMDWQRTNSSPLVRWADRITPDHAQQTTNRGVAIEYMVDLCNELGADPWFCLPHESDDDFVRQFARLVLARLGKERKVYVEYSNELWNMAYAFQQSHRLKAWADARGRTVPETVAEEARRRFAIWSEEWRGQEQRVVRVVGGWLVQPKFAENVVARLDGEFDAIAPAAYFSFNKKEADAFDRNTTAELILQKCLADIEGRTLPSLQGHRDLAAAISARLGRPIALLCYEGGQHVSTNGRDLPWQNAGAAAQSHPLMRDCYNRLLQGCRESGVQLFCAYNYVSRPGKFGSWGHLKHQDEPDETAVKWQALLQFSKPTEAP